MYDQLQNFESEDNLNLNNESHSLNKLIIVKKSRTD